jgi:hypothetical protein
MYGQTRRWNPEGLDKLISLVKFGPIYLNEEELRTALASHERKYYMSYVRNLLSPERSVFVKYHRDGHRRIGYRFRASALVLAAVREILSAVLNPLLSLSRLKAHWTRRVHESRDQ